MNQNVLMHRSKVGVSWFYLLALVLVCLASGVLSVTIYFAYYDFVWLNLAKEWRGGSACVFSPNPWNTFRPGTQLLLFMNYLTFGSWAPGYHLVSLLLHIATTISVFSFVRYLTNSDTAGFVAGVVFAVAVGHQEAVTWISAQAFLVVGLIAVFALRAADGYCRGGESRRLLTCGLLSILAPFVHEIGVLVPMGVVIYACLVAGVRRRSVLFRISGVALGALVIWFFAYSIYYCARGQETFESGEPSLLSFRHLLSNMSSAVPSLIFPRMDSPAIRHRLPEKAPWAVGPLNATWNAARFILPLLGFVGLLMGSSLVRFGILWCLVGLCMGSLSAVGFAGRYAYLPMIGLAIAIGAALQDVKWKPWSILLTRSLVVLFVVCSIGANVVTLTYLSNNGRQRQHLIRQVIATYKQDRGRRVVFVSGLPDKFHDVVEGARYFGARAQLGQSSNSRAAVNLTYREGYLKKDDGLQ